LYQFRVREIPANADLKILLPPEDSKGRPLHKYFTELSADYSPQYFPFRKKSGRSR
jgi:hypothetical protein